MKTLGYYNGTIGELDQITVPMLDRACYFGDGVYDVTYSRNYKVFALEEHLEQFYRSASLLQIFPRITKSELTDLLEKLLHKMDTGDLWIYLQFSRGSAPRTHAFPEGDVAPNLWIMLKPAVIRDTYQPMRCISGEDTRFYHCNIKSLNLLPNVLATQAATAAGVDECILHRGETVTECAHSNLFILKDGVLLMHPANELIYAGTGRAHLLALCRKVGFPTEERPYTMAELKEADEVLITSASALCMRVMELDGKPIGGKQPELIKTWQDALLRNYLKETEA